MSKTKLVRTILGIPFVTCIITNGISSCDSLLRYHQLLNRLAVYKFFLVDTWQNVPAKYPLVVPIEHYMIVFLFQKPVGGSYRVMCNTKFVFVRDDQLHEHDIGHGKIPLAPILLRRKFCFVKAEIQINI